MDIDWEFIFKDTVEQQSDKISRKPSKFKSLPQLLPWSTYFDENLSATVEMLYRSGKKLTSLLEEENHLLPIREGWYRSELDEGLFVHACYPSEIISFRRKYECVFNQIKLLLDDPSGEDNLKGIRLSSYQAEQNLWAAWACLGFDGQKAPPAPAKSLPDDFNLETFGGYANWKPEYYYQCSRCCTPIPKATKSWIKFNNTKLMKTIVNS